MQLVFATGAKGRRTYTRITKRSDAMTKGESAELASTRRRTSVPHQASGNAMGNVEAERYHTKNSLCSERRTRESKDAMIAFRSMIKMLLHSKSNA